MKTSLLFTLFFVSTAAIVPAHAQVYQWKDGSGRTIVSDTPPPGSAKSARTLDGPSTGRNTSNEPTAEKPAEKTADKPADADKTMAEKDLEFKKRQQEAREKADKEATERKVAADKKENCARARSNLAAMESKQPVATFNSKGERQLMDDTQRQKEIARSRQIVAESCN